MIGLAGLVVALSVLRLSFSYLALAQEDSTSPMSGQDDDRDRSRPDGHARPSPRPWAENEQNDRKDRSGELETAETDTDDEDAPAADRIVAFLKQQPEELVHAKQVAIQYPATQNAGEAIAMRRSSPETEATELSDEELFQRIEQDDDFRLLLIQVLRNRGYRIEPDRETRIKPTSTFANRHRSSPAADTRDRIRRSPVPPAEDPNQPPTSARPNPYPGLPSTRDLYRQFSASKTPLQRFGMDLFRNGTGNPDKLPIDLPAGLDYVLGPGDGVTLEMHGSVSRSIVKTIDREGRISLPEAGALAVNGQTIAQAQESINQALAPQFRDVKVELSLTRLRSIRVYVVGDVERPGAYDISSLSTPLNALYLAGGPTARGSLRAVRQYRGDRLLCEVDLYDLLLHGVRAGVQRLESGDTILVPPIGAKVSVAGMVRRPAIYELKDQRELGDVLQLAGGLLVSATLRQITVERIEAHQRRALLNVDLPATAEPSGLEQALRGFTVQDGDYVTISSILPYSEQTVYLSGHVFHPGKYPYHAGMQILELLRSYSDLLPEPADHAEIVRLLPPDNHPEAIEFKLTEILAGLGSLALQPFDTVRIFGRYEVDPPMVSIFGSVRRPGEYPLASGMKATDLVRLAGGFRRSAYTGRADVADYRVQDGGQVVTELKTVDIAKALSGDATADLMLKPGNVVTIRQLPGWKDIGVTVAVSGQVQYPGSYGIENGEKLSTLLKQAGGFRENAYPRGAVLERRQVREQEEMTRLKLIQKIESEGVGLKISANTTGQDQAALLQAMTQQRQQIVSALRNQPATGRLVIRISGDLESWQNTSADIELRAGDVVTIPRNPSFVLVAGQVYNPTAISYAPGHDANWYLRQAGGATRLANKADIYIIRANGSVVSQGGSGWGLWKGNVLNTSLWSGDTLVVPEKILGGSSVWKSILEAAQLASNVTIAARVATSF